MTATARPASGPRLDRAGVTRMVTVLSTLVIMAAIFFLAAGTVRVGQAWLYYGGLFAYLVIGTAVMLACFPEAMDTVNARGRLNKDVKTWDKVFGLVYTLLLLVQPAVAGWDRRAVHSLDVSWPVACLALAVTVAAYAFVHWAMIVNRHAETGVRIQSDRGHVVISSGPYRVVRHPFYISLIVTQLAYPLAVGALYAYIPSLAIAAIFVWRTAREDETLRRELEGYEAFTERTRYRLLPGVW